LRSFRTMPSTLLHVLLTWSLLHAANGQSDCFAPGECTNSPLVQEWYDRQAQVCSRNNVNKFEPHGNSRNASSCAGTTAYADHSPTLQTLDSVKASSLAKKLLSSAVIVFLALSSAKV